MVDGGKWEPFLVRAFTGDREIYDSLCPFLCIHPHPSKFPRPDDDDYRDIGDEQLRPLVRAARTCGPQASDALMQSALSAMLLTNTERQEALARLKELQSIPVEEAVHITRQGAVHALSKKRTENAFKEETSLTTWTPDAFEAHMKKAMAPVLALVMSSRGPVFSDLVGLLAGDVGQEVPTVAEAWEGQSLFYAGRLNELHSEPGKGKTNILISACISVLRAGGSVLYIDPEDTPRGFVSRFIALGGDPADIARVHYLHNPTPQEITAAQVWAQEHHPTLVILDGLAESMAAEGKNEDKAVDVLAYFRASLRPFAEAGAAVVIADHVTKSAEGRGQFARGSGAKAGRYDGVSYEIISGVNYTPTTPGHVKLKVCKDRNGGVGPGGWTFAEIHFKPTGPGRTSVTFLQPEHAKGEQFRPTVIMEKIVARLKTCGVASARELRTCGKAQAVDLAVEIMLREGNLVLVKRERNHEYSLPNSRGDSQ